MDSDVHSISLPDTHCVRNRICYPLFSQKKIKYFHPSKFHFRYLTTGRVQKINNLWMESSWVVCHQRLPFHVAHPRLPIIVLVSIFAGAAQAQARSSPVLFGDDNYVWGLLNTFPKKFCRVESGPYIFSIFFCLVILFISDFLCIPCKMELRV